jgi:tetratricopeptide (TPR) repeat protein
MKTDGSRMTLNKTVVPEPSFDVRIDAMVADPQTADGHLWVVSRAEPGAVAALVETRAAAIGVRTLAASWRAGFARPFGPVLDVIEDVVAYLEPRRPELFSRFGWTLSNVLYPWRRSSTLYRVGELRAGLADLALRGDARFVHEFFQKRNVRPQMLAYIVRLITEGARLMVADANRPLILHLANAHLADSLTLSVFQLLRRHAQQHRVPLKMCLIGASDQPGPFRSLVQQGAGAGWTITTADDPLPGVTPAVESDYTPEEIEALRPVSACALPFRAADWIERLPEALHGTARRLLDRLVEQRVLTEVGPDRVRFVHDHVRDAIHATCAPEVAQSLHAAWLQGDEAADPFAAAWHARVARPAHRRALCLDAMERAWAVSAYDCALELARAAFDAPGEGREIDPNLVLALLNYEAGDYGAADRLFDAAYEAQSPIVDRDLIRYLKGYNAVFGTGEYAKGIGILTSILATYEEKRDSRSAAYVRNSIAYAHFRSKNLTNAIEAEEANIHELGGDRITDSFLQSILQLNLGRLYNHVGDLTNAIRTVEAALHAERKELSSHTLLLCYATLGSLQSAAGQHHDALHTYRHVFELLRNMQLDSVKDQVVFALSKLLPYVPANTMTRTDEILFYVHLHLGATCQRLGLTEFAQAFREAVMPAAADVSPEFAQAVAKLFATAQPAAPARTGSGQEAVTDVLPSSCHDLIRPVVRRDPVDVIAATLAEGGTVALLDEHDVGGGIRLRQSVVLFDVRGTEPAERISSEFGGSYVQTAAAALILPEGVERFVHLESRTGVQQVATLKHEHCAAMPGLVPVGLNVQVVSQASDGVLHRILTAFADRSGVPLLGVAPFHLWRGDLVVTAQQALLDFLITSVDRLYLSGRVVEKIHGPAAIQNIAEYRPRLSEEALVFENGGACLIRIKRRGGYATDQVLKLHADTRPIIDRCDGSRSVGALLASLTRAAALTSPQGERLASLLRGLWRHGALCFDPPAAEPAAARAAMA